jgi:hypothetical protein
MSTNNKQTSDKVSGLASEILRDSHSSAIAKSLAASALAQAGTNKETGKAMEQLASKVLSSEKYSDKTHTLAASVLAQSNKKR